ncbi:DNA-binding protein H-NS [Roseateles asaccharophilus]|uniref:H-NS histone family protein n=1 Tax=Roseateles asaccharophilus TaxID=582607 RepID=UPI003838DEF5
MPRSSRKPAQIAREIQKLQAQLDRARAASRGVLTKVRKLVADYGLTVEEVFGVAGQGAAEQSAPAAATPAAASSGAKASGRKPGRKASPAKGVPVPPKFRNGTDTWSGRGTQPVWLRDAISKGAKLEDFLISKATTKAARKASVANPFVKADVKKAPAKKIASKRAKPAAKTAPAVKDATKRAAAKPKAARKAPAKRSAAAAPATTETSKA